MNTQKYRLYAAVRQEDPDDPIRMDCEKVTELFDNGEVELSNHPGQVFRPITMLPSTSGRKFQAQLAGLRAQYRQEAEALRKRYMDLYRKVIPW